jgi:hypothetical protein
MRYPGHLLKTLNQAAAQGAVILGVLLPLLAWRINNDRAVIAIALAGVTLTPVVIAVRAWRHLARQEPHHPQPTPDMIFIFQLVTTMPLVMGAFLMMLLAAIGR